MDQRLADSEPELLFIRLIKILQSTVAKTEQGSMRNRDLCSWFVYYISTYISDHATVLKGHQHPANWAPVSSMAPLIRLRGKGHVRMKIAPQPPPPLLLPAPILPWCYLTLLSIRLPSRFIFEDYTPTNFDTFPAAIMTVFQVWLPQIPSFCLLSMTHCTLGYFSPQAQIKQLCSHTLHPLPPLSSHTSMRTYAHMNIRQVKREQTHIRSATKPTALWNRFDQHT